MAQVTSVNISEKKGTVKREVPEIRLKLRPLLPRLEPGTFAENNNTRGVELKTLPVGTRLRLGETVVEVTQIGKECRNDCEIKRTAGKYVMPAEGIFAVVVKEGTVRKGDEIEILREDCL